MAKRPAPNPEFSPQFLLEMACQVPKQGLPECMVLSVTADLYTEPESPASSADTGVSVAVAAASFPALSVPQRWSLPGKIKPDGRVIRWPSGLSVCRLHRPLPGRLLQTHSLRHILSSSPSLPLRAPVRCKTLFPTIRVRSTADPIVHETTVITALVVDIQFFIGMIVFLIGAAMRTGLFMLIAHALISFHCAAGMVATCHPMPSNAVARS